MGESRKQRRARIESMEVEALETVHPDVAAEVEKGPREKGSQRAGRSFLDGDRSVATVLEEALRQRGRVERATHPFHTYPAGLHADAVRMLLGLGAGPVLDPFCGGGTVLVESILAGREALGLDVSAVACLVARARVALTSEADRTALRSGARRAAAAAMATVGQRPPEAEQFPEEVRRSYEPHAAAELVAIRNSIGNDPALRAVMSAILVKASLRVSDTVNRLEPTRTRPPGTTATLFHSKAREYARMLAELAQAVPAGVSARVHREDSREFRAKAPFGQVVTSPPYPGVYDYAPMQALRRFWLDLDDERAMREEIGARRNFRADRATAIDQWKADSRAWVKAVAKALGTGGRMVVVIGDGQVGDVRIDAWNPLDAHAREVGLRFVGRASVERWDEGLSAMRPEHAGVWEKPAVAG